MSEIIEIDDTLQLRAVEECHVAGLYQLVRKNSAWLQQFLDWPQYVNTQEDTYKTVQGNMMLHQRGYAKMFLIFDGEEMLGVLSFNQIEPLNKAA